jgi:hypothetical protein
MVKNLPTYLAYVRKALINITGLVAALLALGLLPDEYNEIGAAVLGVLTALTHFFTPNAPAPGNAPAVEDFSPEDEGAEVPYDYESEGLVSASQVAAEHEIAAPPGSESAVATEQSTTSTS